LYGNFGCSKNRPSGRFFLGKALIDLHFAEGQPGCVTLRPDKSKDLPDCLGEKQIRLYFVGIPFIFCFVFFAVFSGHV